MTRPLPPGSLRRRSLLLALGAAAWRVAVPASLPFFAATAEAATPTPELVTFDIARDEDGVHLSYAVDFELGRGVEEALMKAVPLYFVAEADIFRDRWYWRDRRVAHAVRTWRIVYQPLTSTWRVTTVGGLSQNFSTQAEALATLSRGAQWRIAEPGQLEEGSRHYLEFQYRLDTSQLPRPMQIGISGEADWQLAVKRTQRIN